MYSNKFKEMYEAEVAKFPGASLPTSIVESSDDDSCSDIVDRLRESGIKPGQSTKIGNITIVPVGYFLCTSCCRFYSEDPLVFHEQNTTGIPRIDTCPECKG